MTPPLSGHNGTLPPLPSDLDAFARGAVARLLPENEVSRTYASRNAPQESSHPSLCSNAQDWVRHDLRFAGVSYPLSVFVSRERNGNWPTYEAHVRAGVEILRRMLGPESMDRLIHSGRGPDLSFYFAHSERLRVNYGTGPLDLRRLEALDDAAERQRPLELAARNCGITMDPYERGAYQVSERKIVLFEDPSISWLQAGLGSSQSDDPTFLEEARVYLAMDAHRSLQTFLHEIGHALHYTFFLSSWAQAEGLAALFHWSERQPSSQMTSGLWPLQGLETLLLHGVGSRSDQYSHHYAPYSSTNMDEYFAVGFAEYLQRRDLSPDRRPILDARNDLFDALFSGGIPHPEALATSRIQEFFRRQGVSYQPIYWVPQVRLESYLSTNLELGGALYVGARHTLVNLAVGGQVRFQSPFSFNPRFSAEIEGSLGMRFNFGSLHLGLEGFLRGGMQADSLGSVPIFGLGARMAFSRRYVPGSSFVLGAFEEFNPLRQSYPFHVTLGWAHAF